MAEHVIDIHKGHFNRWYHAAETDYYSLDPLTLCKLLTLIVLADRFTDGNLVYELENGNDLNILKALSQKTHYEAP